MRKAIGIIVLVLASSLPTMAQTTDNMNRIEACKQNYHTLFGGEALTGQGPDPEMMDILQKFIFGEVWKSHATLTLLAKQDLPTFGYNTIDPLKPWCWGSILFYPFKNSHSS